MKSKHLVADISISQLLFYNLELWTQILFYIINHLEFWSFDKLLIVIDVYLTNNILPKMFSWLRDLQQRFCPSNDPIFLPSDSTVSTQSWGKGCSMLIAHLENATISNNTLGCFYCLCSPVSESDTNTFEMWKLYIKPIFISIVVTHLSRYYSVIVLSHTAICYTHDSSKVHFCEQQAGS